MEAHRIMFSSSPQSFEGRLIKEEPLKGRSVSGCVVLPENAMRRKSHAGVCPFLCFLSEIADEQ